MRTDVKVGLVCVFAVVLGVVCYFTLHDKSNNVSSAANTPSAAVPQAPAAGGIALAPPSTEPSVSNADLSSPPMLAAGGSLLGPAPAYGQISPPSYPPNNMGATVILPPGAATNPSMSNGSGALTPPQGSMNQPLIPSPGLSAPGTPSPGLSTVPLLPSAVDSPATMPSTSILPTASPFGSEPAPAPKPGKRGKSKLPTSTINVMDQTPTNNVDVLGGSAGGSTYAIQKGDTFGALAKRNGVSVKAILAANPGANPTQLKVGQKINIPAAGAASSSSPAISNRAAATRSSGSKKNAKSGTPHAAVSGGSYTVKKGDTLRKIAKATYGDENMWRRIFRANRGDMASANDLTVGEVIKLPSTK